MPKRKYDDEDVSDLEVLKALKDNDRGKNIVLLEHEVGLKYDEYLVDMETFLRDPYYLGWHGADLWPVIFDDLIALFEGGSYDTVILTGAIGWGKDFFSAFAIARMIYEVSCLSDPQTAYGLAKDSTVVFKNFSVNATKARKVLFEELAVKMRASPYFNEKFPYEKGVLTELRFPKHIRAEPGNSQETSALGENIFGAAIDEVNFLPVVEKSRMVGVRGMFDQAERLFSAARRRMKSRFKERGPRPGMLIALSSKQYPDDFTERKVEELKDDPKTFIRSYSEWETKPKGFYSGRTFDVEVNDEYGMCRILTGEEEPDLITGEVVEVPIEWKPEFVRDIEGSVREIAGRSTLAIRPFIMNRAKIYEAIVEDWTHPFTAEETTLQDGAMLIRDMIAEQVDVLDDEGKKTGEKVWVPKLNPKALRAIHLDPSVSGDAFGFCMGHIDSYEMRQRSILVDEMGEEGRRVSKVKVSAERLPIINVDMKLRIVPPPNGEIQFSDVRSLIYQLTNLGFKIGIISGDSQMSKETAQILERRGYHVEYLSVDADIEPYNRAKTALYDERIRMYWFDCLIEELKRLERLAKGGKEYVDHPANFHKDVADAFAGMIYDLETMEIQPLIEPSLGKLEGKDELADARMSEEEYRWLYGREPPKKKRED